LAPSPRSASDPDLSRPVADAEVDDDELTFAQAFDYYQRVVYDGPRLGDSIARLIRSVGASRILDCAAGVGLPALHLRRLGFDVSCSDGDEAMVARFAHNADLLGLDPACRLLDWDQLDPAEGRYDYVMCRGNSLVYATSWGPGRAAADHDRLAAYLRRFASVLEPGGHLQVDAPRMLAPTRYDGSVVIDRPNDDPVLADRVGSVPVELVVQEQVEVRDNSRFWACFVALEPTEGPVAKRSFSMHSSRLTIDDLAELLDVTGFEVVDLVELDGDRGCHPTILARKR
jgi:SAM-dependent methyltransferase